MEIIDDQALVNWVLEHAAATDHKLYFTINGDVPLTGGAGEQVYYEVLLHGKRVCVLHPEHLTRVARACHESGVQMVQVLR